MGLLIVEAQCLTVDDETDGLRLAGLEHHLAEGFQFLHGAGHAALQVADIELHHLGSGTVARIGHVDAHGEPSVGGHLTLVGLGVRELERGIAESIAEGEKG